MCHVCVTPHHITYKIVKYTPHHLGEYLVPLKHTFNKHKITFFSLQNRVLYANIPIKTV